MELLLPAGNIDSFFAAIEGGADAIYLGMKNFNARKRAKNFSSSDIYNIIKEAHSRKVKIYVTLNTIIKNRELPELIQSLSVLSQLNVDAVIIQDFALISLIHKYFPKLNIHASTQMMTHNSVACNFFEKEKFERVILARELTKKDIGNICRHSKIDKEIFIHGALCYSYSGSCLFSSYLGGNSGNRGMCTQVCRRIFENNENQESFFSLKDLELADYIPFFKELNIKSLKIEGRMKTKEYIYNTARAYKMILQNNSNIESAKKILQNDFAREKTAFFYGEKLQNIFTQNSGIGKYIGKTINANSNSFQIVSKYNITEKSYIRLQNEDNVEIENLKINKISKDGDTYTIFCETSTPLNNYDFYLVGNKEIKINTQFKKYENKKFFSYPQNEIRKILSAKKRNEISLTQNDKYYLRISDITKFQELRKEGRTLNKIEKVFIKLQYSELLKYKDELNSLSDKSKYVIELPKTINEDFIVKYKNLLNNYKKNGFNIFGINHISQIDIIPKESKIFSCENIYLLNDLAIDYVKGKGVSEYVYPYENDYPNMISGNDRNGIVPIYFTPELFYSRVPIKAKKTIKDKNLNCYNINVIGGNTILTDSKKVSMSQYYNKIKNKGFYKFLIDFSYNDDYKILSEILEKISKSEKIQNSNDFNFKKELR